MLLNLILVIGIIILIWLSAITFLYYKFLHSYQKLISKDDKKSLVEVLNDVLSNEKKIKKDIDELYKKCDTLEKEGALHVQKMGLSRFNPFKDTGGDQSFILALLNAQDTGVVVSSLHSRTGTRWYAKKVVKGKGIEYDLSDDEEKAVKNAKVI